MSTVTYSCGCMFHHSMFGARETMGFCLCPYHAHLFWDQQISLSKLQTMVFENPIPEETLRRMYGLDEEGNWKEINCA